MHLPELISDLAIMLLTAGVVTVIFKKIKQPLVLGYIVAGFLIGPYMPFFFTTLFVKMRLERSAERDKREIKNNFSADIVRAKRRQF